MATRTIKITLTIEADDEADLESFEAATANALDGGILTDAIRGVAEMMERDCEVYVADAEMESAS